MKYIVFIGLVAAFGCADLNVENLNEPDKARALATADDLIGLASGTFRKWYNHTQEYDGPALAMGVMADWNSCSWGNAGMNDFSTEPRKNAFQNDITYAYFYPFQNMWNGMYSSLSAANDVLVEIEKGTELGPQGSLTESVKIWCKFMQGLTHGYIGLTYDRGNIIDETTDLVALELFGYEEVSKAAIAKLQEALNLVVAAEPFVLPTTFVRGFDDLDNARFEMVIRSYLAKMMISWPRNGTEAAAEINWNTVLDVIAPGGTYKGLDFDFSPDNDDITWYNNYLGYQTYPGWGRVDHRVINLMCPTYFSRWPDNSDWASIGLAGDPGPAPASADARFATDFGYMAAQAYRPDRGHYHFSHYRYVRYLDWLVTWTGRSPLFLEWEARLIYAEALLRTGNKAGAIAVLNDATQPRKVRGALPDVAAGASDADVLDAIFYERQIELYNSGMANAFFDMRRMDFLQWGTLNHFPMPITEIQLVGIPFYTIGENAPDGWDRALYGWVGKDGQMVPVGGWPGYPAKPAPGAKPSIK